MAENKVEFIYPMAVDVAPPIEQFGSSVKEQIQGVIKANSDKTVVFGRTNCFYSAEAIGVLKKLNVPFIAYQLDEFDKKKHAEVHEALKQLYNQSTVPYIFVDGDFIGGCDDLKRKYNRGHLHESFKNSIKNVSKQQLNDDSSTSSDGVAVDLPVAAPKVYRTMFWYCQEVDGNVARVVGGITLIICILTIVFREQSWAHWLMFALFIDSLLRFFFGGQISPIANISKLAVRSILKPHPVSGLPKQFAALCATFFSGISALFFLLSFDDPQNIGGCIPAGIMGFFAFLECFFEWCAACKMFELAAHFGWADIFLVTRSSQDAAVKTADAANV